MKISELTEADVREYARMLETGNDISPKVLLESAKAYVRGYTGRTDAELDSCDDISIAILALCADMYDNRQMAVENDKVNRVVQSILDMHVGNLL